MHDDHTVLGDITIQGDTRASFLLKAALAAGATLGVDAVMPFTSRALAQTAGGDVDILNYALTLEMLEADFYAQAIKKGGLSSGVRELAQQLSSDESSHVDALTKAIRSAKGTPKSPPTFDFGSAFSDEATFLKYANTLEDTGVSAYNGAATAISSKDVLGSAGSIVQIEARHSALIRLERDKPPSPQAFDKSSPMDKVLAKVKPYIKG